MHTVFTVVADPRKPKAVTELDFHREYALKGKLGQGTYSVVYAATRTDGSNGQLAVKVVDMRDATSKQLDFDNEAMRLDWRRHTTVMNEAAMLSAVSGHENICRMSEFFMQRGLAYIVLESYEKTLCEALDATAILNEVTLRPFLHGMLTGVAAVHARRIVHRDIKPENFMCCGPDKTVKLCDFHVACALAPGDTGDAVEFTGVVGTLPYMAPEILQNVKYGTKVDVWSLGAVAHVLLCGCLPYVPHEMTTTLMKQAILQGYPTPRIFLEARENHHAPGGVSEAAKALVVSMLSRSATKRPSSREALGDGFFTSRSLSRTCLRQTLEAARRCGAFSHAGSRKMDIGGVDVRLQQLQEHLGHPVAAKARSPASDASTDVGSNLADCSELPKGDDPASSSGLHHDTGAERRHSQPTLWFNLAGACCTLSKSR